MIDTQNILNHFFNEIENIVGEEPRGKFRDEELLNSTSKKLDSTYINPTSIEKSAHMSYDTFNTRKTSPNIDTNSCFTTTSSTIMQSKSNFLDSSQNASATNIVKERIKGYLPNSSSNTLYLRQIAGKKWTDASLAEWPTNDHRLFVGNLSKDVTDEVLAQHFSQFSSLNKTRVIRDKYTKSSKGYGFISFLDVTDFSNALKHMEGTYIINRPCKLYISKWAERTCAIIRNGKFKRCIESEQFENTCPLISQKGMRNHIGGIPSSISPSSTNNKHFSKKAVS
jgi:hypothetical protein